MENEKRIEFRPAFDKRNDPKGNFGIHGVELCFYYGNKEQGFIQFITYTNWHLPHLRKKWDEYTQAMLLLPQPADLGYHSHKPRHAEQEPLTNDCPLLGGTCYYDGSSLNALRIFEILVEKGSDGVWIELEKYWKEVFEETN